MFVIFLSRYPGAATWSSREDAIGMTSLHASSYHGWAEITMQLLSAKASPDATRSDGAAPLHFAVQGAHVSGGPGLQGRAARSGALGGVRRPQRVPAS